MDFNQPIEQILGDQEVNSEIVNKMKSQKLPCYSKT